MEAEAEAEAEVEAETEAAAEQDPRQYDPAPGASSLSRLRQCRAFHARQQNCWKS
jgi:hypothetical protein